MQEKIQSESTIGSQLGSPLMLNDDSGERLIQFMNISEINPSLGEFRK